MPAPFVRPRRWRPSRRALLGAGGVLAGGAYATVIEPGLRLTVREHALSLPGWGNRPPLVICALADLHAGEPLMPLSRVRAIVAAANALAPDLHVILGDLPAHMRAVLRPVPMPAVADALAELRAPLGRWAILGNHDWWDDPEAEAARRGPPAIARILEAAGVPVLRNAARRLPHGAGIWLLGTDSSRAFRVRGRGLVGADDIRTAMGPLHGDEAPAILLAHEPDQFPGVPSRIALTLSGHTHGGQVRLFGWSPVVPSRHGNRYALGLVREAGRALVVSGGLGCSVFPARFGVPPELTLVRIGGQEPVVG